MHDTHTNIPLQQLRINDGDELIFDGSDPSTYTVCETAEQLKAASPPPPARRTTDDLPGETIAYGAAPRCEDCGRNAFRGGGLEPGVTPSRSIKPAERDRHDRDRYNATAPPASTASSPTVFDQADVWSAGSRTSTRKRHRKLLARAGLR
jgi:hypothetical protein